MVFEYIISYNLSIIHIISYLYRMHFQNHFPDFFVFFVSSDKL